jgi:hypothetical protein
VITETVTIDGYTQPGTSVNTASAGTNARLLIQLSGDRDRLPPGQFGLRIQAPNTVVRGLVINRFYYGIYIEADGVRVLGCFLGTDATATQRRANAWGIYVNHPASDAVIGNGTLAGRNLISANAGGVTLGGGTGARVLGNLIGTDRTGTAPLGNRNVSVRASPRGAWIGGDGAAEANTIRFNGGDGRPFRDAGVAVPSFVTGTRILRNAIGDNDGPGIDLIPPVGRTANDAGDADAGANNRQNFPVIAAATTDLVRVTLDSVPNQSFTVRLYSNPAGGDEGLRYHGAFAVSTGAGGNTAGPENDLIPNPLIPVGRSVTATATRGNGDTSEFSPAVPVAP